MYGIRGLSRRRAVSSDRAHSGMRRVSVLYVAKSTEVGDRSTAAVDEGTSSKKILPSRRVGDSSVGRISRKWWGPLLPLYY